MHTASPTPIRDLADRYGDGDPEEETCALRRQPVSRCPAGCDHGFAPPRPARTLHPLAEAIIAAGSASLRVGNGAAPGEFAQAKRRMLHEFAQIGVSPDYLALLRRVL